MDRNIKYCIDQLYNAGQLTETNYNNLINALDEYHEASERINSCKSRYLIGEKVYVEKDYFDKSNKNHVALITIESIAYDANSKCYIYNYLYNEDEVYPTEEDLRTFLRTKYYQEYEEKIIKVCNELKSLTERGDIYAKR